MSVVMNPAALAGVISGKMPKVVWVCETGGPFRSLASRAPADVGAIGVDPLAWTDELGNLLSTSGKVVLVFASDHFGDAMAALVRASIRGDHVSRYRPQAPSDRIG